MRISDWSSDVCSSDLEVGRAGRDGDPAEGITLYGARDISWALRRIDEREIADNVKAVQTRKVRQLYAFLDGFTCRRAAVRRYFGDSDPARCGQCDIRSEEHTSELQSLMRTSYAVFCLNKKQHEPTNNKHN